MFIFLLLLSTIIIVKSEAPSPRCPSNMVQSHLDPTICYLFVANATNFENAENICFQNNGHLTPVLNAHANFFISDNAINPFKNFSNDFWIGGRSINVNDATIWLWTWHDSFISYSDWRPGEPSKNGCIISTTDTALWSAQDCGTAKPFVCQIPAIVDVCDAKWSYFKPQNLDGKPQNLDGMCYRYMSQQNITFLEAQNVCLNQNSNLVSIHKEEENSFLVSLATYGTPEHWPVQGIFIGLQYIESAWKWLDGTDVNYVNWGPNAPYDETKRTAALFYADPVADDAKNWTHKWDNYFLTYGLNRFICKKKPNIVSITEKL